MTLLSYGLRQFAAGMNKYKSPCGQFTVFCVVVVVVVVAVVSPSSLYFYFCRFYRRQVQYHSTVPCWAMGSPYNDFLPKLDSF